MSFIGAKLALFIGADLLTILRDDRPDIPFPGHWDFPGGGREGGESPEACALRETAEEVGLVLAETDLVWSNRHVREQGVSWFFAAHLPGGSEARVRLGDEGQGWALMSPEDYCDHPLAIAHFVEQLRQYQSEGGF